MNGMIKKALIVALLFSIAGLLAGGRAELIGQEQAQPAKFRGRLPSYYADIVTDQQKTAIYTIQARYHAKVAALQEELETLDKKLDAEIESVLTPAQKTMLKKAREEGTAKRKKTAADKKLAEAEKNAAAAAAPMKKAVRK